MIYSISDAMRLDPVTALEDASANPDVMEEFLKEDLTYNIDNGEIRYGDGSVWSSSRRVLHVNDRFYLRKNPEEIYERVFRPLFFERVAVNIGAVRTGMHDKTKGMIR